MSQTLPPNPDKIGVARHLSAHVLPILTWPNPKLSQQCEDVTVFDDKLGQLIMDMVLTMDTSNGVGLAAPQIGVLKNIVTLSTSSTYMKAADPISTSPPEYSNPFQLHQVLINPHITMIVGDGIMNMSEGCLSVPGYFEKRDRPNKIIVEYQNPSGNSCHAELTNLEAFALQHEMDHLKGRLFIDDLSNLKKSRIKKKVLKLLKG